MPGARTRSRTRAGFFIPPLLAGLLSALHPQVLPAGVLQGRLVDQGTGAPVSGAVVNLRAPSSGQFRSARSDSSGFFRLENLPPGTWNLRLERLGYRPLRLPFRMGAGPAAVEWRLEPIPLLVDELVVRARRHPAEEHVAAFVETIPLDGPRPTGGGPRPDPRPRRRRQRAPVRGTGQLQHSLHPRLHGRAGAGLPRRGSPQQRRGRRRRPGGAARRRPGQRRDLPRVGSRALRRQQPGGCGPPADAAPREQRPHPAAHRQRLLPHPQAGSLDRRPLEGLGVPRPPRLPGKPQRLPLPGRQRHRVQRRGRRLGAAAQQRFPRPPRPRQDRAPPRRRPPADPQHLRPEPQGHSPGSATTSP